MTEKLKVDLPKLDINLKFYFILKYLVKSKLSDKQGLNILEICGLLEKDNLSFVIGKISAYVQILVGDERKDMMFSIIETLQNGLDFKLFAFSLKLYLIKNLLLEEAKLTDVVMVSELQKLDPLSLEYDKVSVYRPYATRVNGALLSLLFFSYLEEGITNFISAQSEAFLKNLSELAIDLKNNGIEPNQIFMLMFSESINQSIISDSGSNYEDRILSVLTKIGIPENTIKKTHDKDDSSTEFDFFFELDNRTYGIGAKRTLRERYKQFIKTAQMSRIDVMIEITLGLDLNEEKAKSILAHSVYIFVADEIYQSRKFLREMIGIYSVKDLNIDTLKALK